jgi:hypothetical protein
MKVKVKKGSTFQTKDGKTHKEGEVLEVGKSISKEEYESHRAKFEQEGHEGHGHERHEGHKEKKDAPLDKAFEDKADKR